MSGQAKQSPIAARRRSSKTVWVLLIWTLSSSPAIVAEPDVVDRYAELSRQVEDDPAAVAAWQQLTFLGNVVARQRLRQEGLWDAQEIERQVREHLFDICRRWVAARPQEILAHLCPLPYLESAAERAELTERAAARFADSAVAIETHAASLSALGEREQAEKLLRDFLAAHPGNGRSWRMLYTNLRSQGQTAAAAELLADWLGALPEDGEARREHLERRAASASPEELRELVTAALATADTAPRMRQVCDAFNRSRLATEAPSCYSRALAAAASDEESEEILDALARQLARLEDWAGLEAVLAEIGEEKRQVRLRGNLASGLAQRHQCAVAIGLLAAIPRRSAGEAASGYAVTMTRCSGEERAIELYLAALTAAPPDRLYSFVTRTTTVATSAVPHGEIERVLLARLEREGDMLWPVLDRYYSQTENVEKRLTHLWRWLDAEPERAQPLLELAKTLRQTGRQPEALRLLLRSRAIDLESHDGSTWLELVTDLAVELGDRDAAADLAERLEALPASHGKRHEGARLAARIAIADERLAEAATHYHRFLDLTPHHAWGDLDEYHQLLARLGRLDELIEILEKRCHTMAVSVPGLSCSTTVALALERLELIDPALDYALDRLGDAPSDGRLMEIAARLAVAVGDWQLASEAYRRRLIMAPDDAEAARQLTNLALATDHLPEVVELLESLSAKDGSSQTIDRQLARLYLQLDRPIEAITLLRRLRDAQPQARWIEDELANAYLQLGQSTED